jgi:hypothetical protein
MLMALQCTSVLKLSSMLLTLGGVMSDFDKAWTREDLLREIDTSWGNLQTYVVSLTPDQLTRLRDKGGFSIKDHLMHIAAWEVATLAQLERRSKREAMDIPAEIGIWGDDDPVNELIQRRYKDIPLDQAMQTFRENHERVVNKLKSMTEEELQRPYREYQPESDDDRPLILWMVGDMIHHYRDHLPWIKAIAEQA